MTTCRALLLDGTLDSRPGHADHDHPCGEPAEHPPPHRCSLARCDKEWVK
jgi:hypothetical protein